MHAAVVARIPDHIVFGALVQMLISGCASYCSADEAVSAPTLCHRRDAGSAAGIMDALLGLALAVSDRMIGHDRGNLSMDCGVTTVLCGGELAGIPRGTVAAPAHRHDAPPYLEPTLGARRVTDTVMPVRRDRGAEIG
jgi:hypothetical protein